MFFRSLGHRAPLLWLALPMLAGLVAGRLAESISIPWLLGGAGAAAGAAALAAWRGNRLFAPALISAMFFAGATSYALHRPRIEAWDTLPPREARLALRVERVFSRTDPRRLAGLATIQRADDPLQELAGQRVYFSLRAREGDPAPVRSAILSAAGVIAALPRKPSPGSFDGYLADAGINFRFERGRVLAEEQAASGYHRFCARQAERFAGFLGVGVEAKRPALVGVYRAMLLGRQQELTEEQETLFRQSGTMHVFSISGLHIAAIAGGLYALLALLRLPRALQFLLGSAALWLYVDITGTAPSAVRAFAMVTLFQASLVLRVPRNPLSALAGSAMLVMLVAPLQVFSASFQMSYGIVAALLLLGLPLADHAHARLAWFRDLPKVSWRWHHRGWTLLWNGCLTAIAIGIAASLVSAVTGVMFFELFTPGSLLANLWLIPAAGAVILGGFVSLLCGLAGFTAGCVLANHAAVLLLWGIEHGVRVFVAIPGAWWIASFRTPWIGGAALAGLLAVMLWGYGCGWRGWHRGYWAPFAVVLAALALGARFG